MRLIFFFSFFFFGCSKTVGLRCCTKYARTVFHCMILGINYFITLGELLAVVNFPWIFTTTTHHLLLSVRLSFSHLFHHYVLISYLNCHEYVLDSFNNEQDHSTYHGLLERYRSTATDRKQASCYKSSHNCIPWVVFLSIMNQKTFTS